jgi:hypothetical protein
MSFNVNLIKKTFELKPETETQFKVNDCCFIVVPYEMSCDGNITPILDGLICKIISLSQEEANIVLDSTETFTLPLFCLKKLDCKLENKKKVAINKFHAESTSNSFPIDKPKENFVDTID